MLVLTRRVGEEVVLPNVRVRITVLSVSGGRIRVGVDAPATVTVLRGELADDDAADGPDVGGVRHNTIGDRRGKARPAGHVERPK